MGKPPASVSCPEPSHTSHMILFGIPKCSLVRLHPNRVSYGVKWCYCRRLDLLLSGHFTMHRFVYTEDVGGSIPSPPTSIHGLSG